LDHRGKGRSRGARHLQGRPVLDERLAGDRSHQPLAQSVPRPQSPDLTGGAAHIARPPEAHSMQQILVYSDSLSWGIVPNTRKRLGFAERWPGVMEDHLIRAGRSVRVIEDCLNGRRTVWEDPFKPGRNGLTGLQQRIEVSSPLGLVVLLLGTNDFQTTHSYNAWHSAQGVATLVRAIRTAPIEPGMPVPEILIVAPPPART